MKRIALILVGLWATAVGPSLCLAGALQHSCEPHHAGDCHHEPTCAADPCGQVIKAQDDCQGISPQLEVTPFPLIHLVEFVLQTESRFVGDIEFPRTVHLPFPRSDVPLRV